MDLIKAIEEGQKRSFTTQFKVGDTVKVYFKIIEGKTERIQVYEGIVLCIKNAGARKTFTVRKESYGVGVERVFPVNSPRMLVKYVVLSFTISVTKSVRIRKLKKCLVEKFLHSSMNRTKLLKLLLTQQKKLSKLKGLLLLQKNNFIA